MSQQLSEAMDLTTATLSPPGDGDQHCMPPPQLHVEEQFAAVVTMDSSSSSPDEEVNSIFDKKHRRNGTNGSLSIGSNQLSMLSPPSPTHSQDSCHMEDAIEQGQLNVHVKRALQRDNSQIDSDMPVYKMTSMPRGKALIVEIEKFDNDVQDQRVGSEVDVQNLKNLLVELHFVVQFEKNLTRQQLRDVLQAFSDDPGHESGDMMVLAVLSHGKDGHIYTSDGMVFETEAIYSKFNNDGCPNLKGKPKFFIIQACRGDNTDKGHFSPASSPSSPISPSSPTASSASANKRNRLVARRKRRSSHTQRDTVPFNSSIMSQEEIDRARPTWEDMIIAYSTIPGFASIRDHQKGTWFIQSLVEVFMNHAYERELIDLLRMTSERLSKFTNEQGEKQTCNIEMRHLYRRIYFNPGLPKPMGSPKLLRRCKSTPPVSPRRPNAEETDP